MHSLSIHTLIVISSGLAVRDIMVQVGTDIFLAVGMLLLPSFPRTLNPSHHALAFILVLVYNSHSHPHPHLNFTSTLSSLSLPFYTPFPFSLSLFAHSIFQLSHVSRFFLRTVAKRRIQTLSNRRTIFSTRDRSPLPPRATTSTTSMPSGSTITISLRSITGTYLFLTAPRERK